MMIIEILLVRILCPNELRRWEADHKQMLLELAPDEFEVLHYGALLELKSKE